MALRRRLRPDRPRRPVTWDDPGPLLPADAHQHRPASPGAGVCVTRRSGASIWRDHAYLPISDWQARHDSVLIEPRGVGASGVIDCPAIQGGVASDAELRAAVVACAARLGKAADRYGSGDVAPDIEAVRTSLNIPAFDYESASYGTVVEQAYAARFPDRPDASSWTKHSSARCAGRSCARCASTAASCSRSQAIRAR